MAFGKLCLGFVHFSWSGSFVFIFVLLKDLFMVRFDQAQCCGLLVVVELLRDDKHAYFMLCADGITQQKYDTSDARQGWQATSTSCAHSDTVRLVRVCQCHDSMTHTHKHTHTPKVERERDDVDLNSGVETHVAHIVFYGQLLPIDPQQHCCCCARRALLNRLKRIATHVYMLTWKMMQTSRTRHLCVCVCVCVCVLEREDAQKNACVC